MKAKLSDISINNKGYYGIGASSVDFNINFPLYLRITDINDNGSLNKMECSINPYIYTDYSKYYLNKYDIVFARTGNSTGRNYMYLGKPNKIVYAGFLIKFSIDNTKILPEYVKYYCQSNNYWNQIHSLMTGSTRPNINAQFYANLFIPLKTYNEQLHIVDIIEYLIFLLLSLIILDFLLTIL